MKEQRHQYKNQTLTGQRLILFKHKLTWTKPNFVQTQTLSGQSLILFKHKFTWTKPNFV
jgi:hypothetical protein